MIRKKQGSIEWLEFELLADIPNLLHGVLLRHGGVSAIPFDSLNLGGGVGDAEEAIAANYSRVREIFPFEKLFSGRQTHGIHLLEVPLEDSQIEKSCDGLITSVPNIGLLIKQADCQAAIFYDPMRQLVANIHCGWRGSVQNIYAKTVAKMGGCPKNLLVCISPSLGPMAAEFKNYLKELPPAFFPFQRRPTYFDFWAISRMQLEEAGVLPHHIEIAEMCTYTNPADFFSYRRDRITGRQGTLVGFL
jgi:polyphenol oxidase